MCVNKKTKTYGCPYCDSEYSTIRGRNIHVRKKHNKSAEELYLYLFHNNIRPLCECGCGKETQFDSWDRGFKKYFSKSHYYNHLSENGTEEIICKRKGCDVVITDKKSRNRQYCSISCSSIDNDCIETIKDKMIEQYGVDNYFKTNEFKEYIEEYNLDKYGVKHITQVEEIKEKSKKTKLKKYGDEHYNNREKEKQTKLEKYGNPAYCNVNQIIETNLKRYNANSFTSTEEGKEKVKSTVQNKYGKEYNSTLQVPEVIEKIEQTNLKKYGVKYPVQTKKVKRKIKLSHHKTFFKKLLKSERLNNKYEPLFTSNDYNGINNDYKFKCKSCNNIIISHLNNGKVPRCFTCEPIQYQQKENEFYNFLLSIIKNDVIIRNDKSILESNKEIDFYLPDHNLAIEFNGLYWHSELGGKKDKEYHLNKTKGCENKGIQLIHIFEDEWDNNSSIIKNKIRHILNKSDKRKIYARKCIIKEISAKQKNDFLNKNHIQSEDRSNIKLGLFYEDELVSVMTFSKPRLALGNTNKGKGIFELSRYATSHHVMGGFGKLFSHSIKSYDINEVFTYADRRWSTKNNIYEKIGFNLDHITSPNYWYLKKYQSREHRFKYRKSELEDKLEIFDPNLTEWENMQLNGFDRIWDCGHYKYIFKK